MSVRVLIRDHPHRTVALTTGERALVFRHSQSSDLHRGRGQTHQSNVQTTSPRQDAGPRCLVEIVDQRSLDLDEYRAVSKTLGTLGLITLRDDVFLCTITLADEVATIRPGEAVQRIQAVDFHCLNRADHDHGPPGSEPYTGEGFASDEVGYGSGSDQADSAAVHPFHALRKLLSNGYFYYSCDFDLTSKLQERAENDAAFDVDNLHQGLLWNSYMINPLLEFRRRLDENDRKHLDESRILTSVIRGFVKSLTIPASASPLRRAGPSNLPSTLTVVSRLSSRRAGTRFNSRGIDDDGNVANFVETETIFWSPAGICFSYVQIRGSIPIFWESSSSLLPGQQKIQITRSLEATQPAFDKHFERLATIYGAVHIVNLLSATKPGEVELTEKYRYHTRKSPLRQGGGKKESSEHYLLRQTEFDFHAETRGAGGYEGARAIRPYLESSADGFAYFLSEDIVEKVDKGPKSDTIRRTIIVLQQEGVFRVNCLDCLDRTNLVQSNISQMALQAFLSHRGETAASDFWMRHSSLWADNGDTLSKIYAGTGALKSSFTRHGKMSLGGAFADVRKSATRLYVNNFTDKDRQNTIDLLLGRLMGQAPVDLYDPVNDYVTAELLRKSAEYKSTESIGIWCGTFNLNGRSRGASENLAPWLCATFSQSRPDPEIVAVGFQEIVELSPQQIMSTDPARRATWEDAVKKTLNSSPTRSSEDDYVVLRSGQLVGAALLVLVKSSVLRKIKNVEGAIKKTGLSGMAGNKGAVAIRLDYASTSLCFVTAHLAAGFDNVEERNRDYSTISHGLRFQKNRSIEDHDSVIWLGDFNYRVGLSNDGARRLVRTNDLDTLYDNDQLNIQMVAGLVFRHYSESRITFPPTYRFDVGTDTYDTSEKNRIPAWCDRILRRGANLRQIDYNSAPLRFSDHRPVFGTFECTISVVNEKVRAALSKKLYDRRKAQIGSSHAAADQSRDTTGSNTDDEVELVDFEPVAAGLPPASSDRNKWWLDNSKPSRSEVRPPRPGMVPNPNRPVNPYRGDLTEESDWVDVRVPGGGSPERLQTRSREGSVPKPKPPPARRSGKAVSAASDKGVRPGDEKESIVSTSPRPARVTADNPSSDPSKRAPPPKPKKPTSLASPPSQTSTFTLSSFDNTEPSSASTTSATSLSQAAAKSALGQGFTRPNSMSLSAQQLPRSRPVPVLDSPRQREEEEQGNTPRLLTRTGTTASLSGPTNPRPSPRSLHPLHPESSTTTTAAGPHHTPHGTSRSTMPPTPPAPQSTATSTIKSTLPKPRLSTPPTKPLNSTSTSTSSPRAKDKSPRRSRDRDPSRSSRVGHFDPTLPSRSREGSADARRPAPAGQGGSHGHGNAGDGGDGGKPSLPPRRGTGMREVEMGLMDQPASEAGGEEHGGGLDSKWKVLRPTPG